MPRPASAAVSSPAARIRRRGLADEVRGRVEREFILNGEISPGELLPSEVELSTRYGVSRVTLRSALRSLHELGLIAIRHGVGSVVLPRSRALTHGLDSLASLESYAKQAGQEIGTRDVEWKEHALGDALAARLQCAPERRVLSVSRVKTLGGERVAFVVDHLLEGTVPFDVVRADFAGSVLDVLMARRDVELAYEDTTVQPVNLPRGLAGRLGVRAGTAVMHLEGVAYSVRGAAIEVAEAWLLPEHFTFSVRRRRQPAAVEQGDV
jgi:DNA-binding GntR family transcriptional regulator